MPTVGRVIIFIIFVSLTPLVASADDEQRAKQECITKIKNTYGLQKFRNTWAERTGNHKFDVSGQARFDGQYHDFQCRVKQGQVKSFTYHGPHSKHGDHDDNDVGVAVGVGLLLAAVAVAASSDDGDHDKDENQLGVSQSVLEDDCHDELQYRVRDEHDRSADVRMKQSRLKGRNLSGEAKVKFRYDNPHHLSFTCHFDSKGRVVDSSYQLN